MNGTQLIRFGFCSTEKALGGGVMRNVNLLLCGNLWQNLGDQQAGWELIRCLRSSDPQVRDAAQEYLVEAGPRSIKLLQAAAASGALVLLCYKLDYPFPICVAPVSGQR